MAALLGTALGIVGSMATTAVGAHYTSKEHVDDCAEARAKDRREALTKTYTAVVVALRGAEGEALRFSQSHDPPTPMGVKIDVVPDDIRAALELTGSPEANMALGLVAATYLGLRFSKAQSPERVDASSRFVTASEGFVDEARKDIGIAPIASAWHGCGLCTAH